MDWTQSQRDHSLSLTKFSVGRPEHFFFFLLEVLCGFPSLPSFADGNVCSPELSRPGVCSTGRACTGQTVHANVIVQIHRWSGSEPKKNERFPSLAPPRRGQLGQTWSASSFSFFFAARDRLTRLVPLCSFAGMHLVCTLLSCSLVAVN